ncbi:PAK4-inhibitor INKA2 [Xenopus tropicalis]|uniref:PAK4-inhibitor INKA2 n=1 Tax=Xenopus tropicalis TaxID=8364 RepID=A9JTN2_XENTR|nr:PAK4-inhibitor INKA2 [Xenopus tropicalis]AAI55412.1 LOC100127801 protein [Xenopus tropicalis]|eukprot:NP_001106588.1 PAK4-inhibitor INKA2 [Xenopus tropicalis]
MDQYIRRLRQELVSMKEVGEGLQEQMNSMMGALQELKLLQVQSALEQLEIAGDQNAFYGIVQDHCCQNVRENHEVRLSSNQQAGNDMAGGTSLDNILASKQGYTPAGSLCTFSMPGTKQGPQVKSLKGGKIEFECSSSILSSVDTGPTQETASITSNFHRQHPMEATNTLPDPDFFIQEHLADESKDWTSSLMSQSRNRQPLVLGDNVFADLVGNWLDLPELEKKVEKSGSNQSISKSQEICKRLSLTANFFKKVLRSVRPDREKLLKEKPGWLHAEDQVADISKRTKKGNKQKGVFYFPSQPDKKILHGVEKHRKKEAKCSKIQGIWTDQKRQEYPSTGFDMNTAVWV